MSDDASGPISLIRADGAPIAPGGGEGVAYVTIGVLEAYAPAENVIVSPDGARRLAFRPVAPPINHGPQRAPNV